MKRLLIMSVYFLSLSQVSYAFPNCNIYDKDEQCYKACKEAEKGVEEFPGSVEFQTSLLKSIELCPEFAFAYFELSVPYAKMGLMKEWAIIMNKAVEINPEEHLGWRGWYHWFFMHNYQKAIDDIEELDRMVPYDIGQTGDGNYHLNVIKGLCYKGLGQTDKAIQVIEEAIKQPDYVQDGYVMIHLAVLYLELGDFEKALGVLNDQNSYNPISEADFYTAICYKNLGNKEKALLNLNEALAKYDNRLTMTDSYRQLPDEIYRSDITNLIKEYSEGK